MTEQDRQRSETPKKTRAQIESEIVQSRAALSDDLAALGEKLSPEHLKEGAREVIREVKHAASDSIREAKEAAMGSLMEARQAAVGSLREAKDHAFESVTERVHELGEGAKRVGFATSGFVSTHALPLGLLGLGVGWLALSMSHQRRRQSGYYEGRPDTRRDHNDWGASKLSHRAAEQLGGLRDQASDLSHEAYQQVRRAGAQTHDFARENPLAVGAIALAAGVGVGLLLPTTERENEWLGEARDKIWDDARLAASRMGERLERTAGELKDALVESPR